LTPTKDARRSLTSNKTPSNRRQLITDNRCSLLRQGVDSFREPEVEFGQAAFAVRREKQVHFIVADVDVGMVLFFFATSATAFTKSIASAKSSNSKVRSMCFFSSSHSGLFSCALSARLL
jgi:hypothetical protein